MVEIRPSEIKLDEKLDGVPSVGGFESAMSGVKFRYVDLIRRSEGDEVKENWINSDTSVVFELRQPSISQMARFAYIIGQLKPLRIDYMHATGDCCVVYWLSWEV